MNKLFDINMTYYTAEYIFDENIDVRTLTEQGKTFQFDFEFSNQRLFEFERTILGNDKETRDLIAHTVDVAQLG